MAWKFLSALFGPGKETPIRPAPPSRPRDTWRGVSDLVDIPESLASLIRYESDDQSARVKALSERLEVMEDQERVEMDCLARRWSWAGDERPAWWSLNPKDLEALAEIAPKGSPHFLGVASFHPSGRVREAALRRLGEAGSPEALPYLLLRLNDWADQVVSLAQDLLPRIASQQSGASVLKHMDLVLKLHRSTRRDQAPWVNHFLDFLSQPEQGDVLVQGFRSSSLPTRRLCYDLALRSKTLSGVALLEALKGEHDPIIRKKVQRAVLFQVQGEARDHALHLALEDPIPSCRKAALEWLEETQAPERDNFCRIALLDRSRAVREVARWTLRQLGVKDLRPPYLAALESTTKNKLIVGIHGMGEVGTKHDSVLVESFVRSPIPSIRNAAITALGRLDAKRYSGVFLEAMASDHPGTSRLATEIITQNGPWPNREWLLNLYRSTAHPHVRRWALSLVHKLPKWQGMAFFLDVMPTDSKALDPTLAYHLEKWLRSMLRVPPPHGRELEEAKARLSEARERLGWRVLPEVDGQLGG